MFSANTKLYAFFFPFCLLFLGLTLVPAWCWLLPAFVLTGYGCSRPQKRWCIAAAILWVALTAVFVEEAHTWQFINRFVDAVHSRWGAAKQATRTPRIATL